MSKSKGLYFTTEVLVYPLLFVFSLWLVFWAELRFGWNFTRYGIYPQKIEGLRGILFGPFIHGSLKHLFNNSAPILVLSMTLFYFYRNIRWKVLWIGILLTGLLTWVIGRPALHIGASGVVYMLAAFLFFKGIFSKRLQLTALAFVVVFLYGSLVWGVLPIKPGISWEGHLSGFIVGLALSIVFRKNHPVENKKYVWEQEDYNPEDDAFMKHFDEDGNFIETLPEETEPLTNAPTRRRRIKIVYTFKKDSDSEE